MTEAPNSVKLWYAAKAEDTQHTTERRLRELTGKRDTASRIQRRNLRSRLESALSLEQRIGEIEDGLDFFTALKISPTFTGFLRETIEHAENIARDEQRVEVASALHQIQAMSAEDMYEAFNPTRYDLSITGERETRPQYPALAWLALSVAMVAAREEPTLQDGSTDFPDLATARDAYTLLGLASVIGDFPDSTNPTRTGGRDDLGVEFSMTFVDSWQLEDPRGAIPVSPSAKLTFRKV